jgi:endonuclease-3
MPVESKKQKAERMRRVIKLLRRYYPNAHCALDHKSPEQLLIATILSAQCTDERVNKVTPQLFEKYPDMAALARTPQESLEEVIRSTGFFRNKAKNLIAMAKELVQKHGGRVPRDMAAVNALAGVGRKTANVVLGNSFAMATGIVVDTHVTRLSFRLGFSRAKSAEGIEKELQALVPEADWIQFSHWLIEHGRTICKARKPDCDHCFLYDECPKNGVTVIKRLRENRSQ